MTDQFRRWYAERMSALFSYIVYQVGDWMTAEDLAAETCERAIRYAAQFDETRGTYDAWIFGIAKNVIRSHYRQKKGQPMAVSIDSIAPLSVNAPTPEQAAEDADKLRHILSQMPLLSDDEREVVALRYGAGLSYAEIAEKMGQTINNVGVLLHRALKRLRAGASYD